MMNTVVSTFETLRTLVAAMATCLIVGACQQSERRGDETSTDRAPVLVLRAPTRVLATTGALFSMWSDPTGLWLERSTTDGEAWTSWRIRVGGAVRYYPYLVARGNGMLAATWFSGFDATLRAHVARIQVAADSAVPSVIEAEPFTPDTWLWGETPGEPRLRVTAGEYFPVAFLRNGRLAVVTSIQDDQGNRSGFDWRTSER